MSMSYQDDRKLLRDGDVIDDSLHFTRAAARAADITDTTTDATTLEGATA
jgi:hypothetical protein